MSQDEQIPKGKNFSWYVYYKLDRSLAIAGVIGIAFLAIWMGKANPDTLQLATAAIGGLIGYVGGRSAN